MRLFRPAAALVVLAGTLLTTTDTSFAQSIAETAPTATDTAQADAPAPDTSLTDFADKAKLYWGSARVEFGQDEVIVRRPTFDVATSSHTTPRAALTDPGLLSAILTPAFEALDGITAPKVQIIDGAVQITHGGVAVHNVSQLNARFSISPASGLLTGKGTFAMRGETATFSLALARPLVPEEPKADEGSQNQKTADTTGATKKVGIPLRFDVTGAGLRARFDGHFRSDAELALHGEINITITDLPKLARFVGFSPSPNATIGEVRAAGDVKWRAGIFDVSNGTFALDGNRASGVLTLDMRKPRTSVQGTLAIDELNLSAYIDKPKHAQQATMLNTLMPTLAPEMTINAPMLRDFDADLRVSVNSITAGAFSAGSGAMTLTLRSGKLLADVAELQAFDGAMLGQFELDVTGSQIKLSGRSLFDGVEASKLMRWVTTVPVLRGAARLTANVAATGQSLGALLSSMTGDMRLTMLNGGAVLIDIDGLMTRAKGKPLVGWDTARRAETRFQTLEAKLDVKNGRVSSRRLVAQRAANAIVGIANVDLTDQSVAVRMTVRDITDGEKRGDTVLSGGPVLTLRGPWDEPSITVEQQARNTVRPRAASFKQSLAE
ncbi:MAG: AsmA family protein [Pseudomonadota bacterium]